MNDIFRALGRALVSQFHPRMLWLAIWPFLLAFLFWGVVAWVFRHDALGALNALVADIPWLNWIDAGFGFIGLGGVMHFLVPFIYLALIFAAMVLTALLIIATVAMPTVVAHVAQRVYPNLVRKHGGTLVGSGLNALWVSIAFIVGFVLTIPLWLFAPLALLLPLLWWGWATSRMLRYDALVDHASAEERNTLFERYGKSFFVIGTSVSLLNFVPPLFFLVPILGGLAFTHFGLDALERLRRERGEGTPGRTADVYIDAPPRMLRNDDPKAAR